jgi:uncharacterized protein (DUF1684 family)
MKSKNVVIIFFVVAVVAVIFYAMQDGSTPEAYVKQIEKDREEKDHFMGNSSASPFADSVQLFKGLKYFPVDGKYRIMASLSQINEKKVIVLKTSDGKEQHYLPYGHAEFNLDGVENKLLILEVMESGINRGTLFLAFGDETSARETYGAGRYLDVKKVSGSTSIILDFNLAYNPYCAYTEEFACPLPPAENLLKVAIKAGEKNY